MAEIKVPIFFSGENPGMTLYAPGTDQAVTVASYWHCTDSPWGVGHALVLWLGAESEIGHGGIFTDNLDLAQILVSKLTQYFPEFTDIPVSTFEFVNASCEHAFDGDCYLVTCQTPKARIEMEWIGPLDRKQLIWPQFPTGTTAFDLTTVICPCQAGHIQLNGKPVAGEVKTSKTANGRPSSTAFLAFAETWVGPLDKKEDEPSR